MFVGKQRIIKFLSFFFVLALVIEFTNVPVQAASRLSKSLKEAYMDTLDYRSELEDISELCTDNVDCEEVFEEYYIALEAYDDYGDNAMYQSVYSEPTKSKQKYSYKTGTPVDFLEYNVVGFINDDGVRDAEVYKCKGTLWFKKISGEYVITKANRSIQLLNNYSKSIRDKRTVKQLTEMIDEFINTEYDYIQYDKVGVEIKECPSTSNKNTVTVSGKVTHDGIRYASLTINGEKIKVDSKKGTWSKNVTLKEGTNTFVFVATNSKGKTYSITKTITYQSEAPSLTIKTCPDTSKTNTVTITGSVSDKNDKYPKVYINGELIGIDYYGNWSKTVSLKEGNNTFEIKAINSAGKATTLYKTITFSLEGPTITFTTFPNTSTNSSVTVTGRVSDNNDKKPILFINDEWVGLDSNNNWSKTLTLKDGVNVFTVKAYNNLGKVSTVTKTITLNGSAPVITLTNFSETSSLKKVTIAGRVTDTNDTAPKVYINDELLSLNSSNMWSKELGLKEGSNTFTIKAVNKLGRVTTLVKTITFNVGAPEIILNECPDSSSYAKMTISGRVNDINDASPKVYLNDELLSLGSNNTWSKEVTLKEGINTYTIKATNSLGKTTTLTKVINLIVEAPNVYLSSFPEVSTTQTVTINGSVSDKNDSQPKVYINGEQITLNWNNTWSKTLTLVEGVNKVEIKAVNSYGKTYSITKGITFGITPPTLDVLVCPETVNTEKVVISGKVSDVLDKNPSVYINGETVKVENGVWAKELTLLAGANTIVIKATNTGGKDTTITKTVTYTPVK